MLIVPDAFLVPSMRLLMSLIHGACLSKLAIALALSINTSAPPQLHRGINPFPLHFSFLFPLFFHRRSPVPHLS